LRKTDKENFKLKIDQIIGGWKKLHNEEVQNVHPLPHVIRVAK
jgi:hypothetical protein